jgi:hypothetical protein
MPELIPIDEVAVYHDNASANDGANLISDGHERHEALIALLTGSSLYSLWYDNRRIPLNRIDLIDWMGSGLIEEVRARKAVDMLGRAEWQGGPTGAMGPSGPTGPNWNPPWPLRRPSARRRATTGSGVGRSIRTIGLALRFACAPRRGPGRSDSKRVTSLAVPKGGLRSEKAPGRMSSTSRLKRALPPRGCTSLTQGTPLGIKVGQPTAKEEKAIAEILDQQTERHPLKKEKP